MMAGAYCKFCDHRCFVYRVIPDGPQKGWGGHLATCQRGMEHDREQTGGYDHTNTVNPMADTVEDGPDPDVCANPDCDHQRAFHHDGICLGLSCSCCEFEEPKPCPTCHGAGGWQQHDGAIEECPRGCMTGARS